MKRVVIGFAIFLSGWGIGTAGLAVAPEGEWTPTGGLRNVRKGHTFTLLLDGRVLAVGGVGTPEAELYDPATGTWEVTGALATARENHTATLLPSGEVLLAGGTDSTPQTIASPELYDPQTGTWRAASVSPTNPLLDREDHTATLLASGEVLVVGGFDFDGGVTLTRLASAQLYDPKTGEWNPTTPLPAARSAHAATLLDLGEVLVTGGRDDSGALDSVLLYTPFDGVNPATWMALHALKSPRRLHTATLLTVGPDKDRLLVAGGRDLADLQSAEIYDPTDASAAASFLTAMLTTARRGHAAALLPSGHVLVAGGKGPLASAELYDPTAMPRTWASSMMSVSREDPGAILLPSGKVLVGGGKDDGALSASELFTPPGTAWTEITVDPPGARTVHTATLLTSGRVLVAGGDTSGAALTAVELYDPSAGWVTAPPPADPANPADLPLSRRFHTATLLPSGDVLVAGGDGGGAPYDTALLFDGASWTPTAGTLTDPRRRHRAVLLASGRVLVAGGADGAGALASAELYDPQTDGWLPTVGAMTAARVFHTATLLASGKVLVTNGLDDENELTGQPLTSAEVYDPKTEQWTATGATSLPRHRHTATLLPSGQVLVAGGSFGSTFLTSAELYDPATGTWTLTGAMTTPRDSHTATLLPSGQVLVAGGRESSASLLASAEVYDPATGTWTLVDALATSTLDHTATLLATGEVLVLGAGPGGELYDPGSFPAGRTRPTIDTLPALLRHVDLHAITGTGFDGDSEASGGTTHGDVNHPLVHLRGVENESQAFLPALPPDPGGGMLPTFSDGMLEVQPGEIPGIFHPGWHLLTVFTAGVPSVSQLVRFECSLGTPQVSLVAIDGTAPMPMELPQVGETVTFEVTAEGTRSIQWFKDGVPIPGATGATYTTPPLAAADSGSRYQARVDSGCRDPAMPLDDLVLDSSELVVTIHDIMPPVVTVDFPAGGEFLLLSDAEESRSALVSWSMFDNIRICKVEVKLLASVGGAPFAAVDPGAGSGLPALFDQGVPCAHPGEAATNVLYTVPTAPPAGTAGALYEIEVTVTDHAGQATVATSPNPFFIVKPNDESVRTLVLWHSQRMIDLGMDVSDLTLKLQELAGHPRVQGRVLDLDTVSSLDALYQAWDAGDQPLTPDPALANDVLFAAGGLHEHLTNLLAETFTGVEYLVMVGDDRVLPLARMTDTTALVNEPFYPSPAGPTTDLTDTTTTVGRALEAGFYLSDDPLAVNDVVAPADLNGENVFVPDLAVGRLVETPEEITTAIATFISQGGILDLTPPASGPDPRPNKFQVTGYDFLIDSAGRTRDRWQSKLATSSDPPIDAALLGQSWPTGMGQTNEDLLLEHLCGDHNGGGPYLVESFNGHATHYEEGAPGSGAFDIQGLDTTDFTAPAVCASGDLDLAGKVIYSVGCHGGLSVAGNGAVADDHPLDMPQAMLGRGVQVYVANTGYGWGLNQGIGYGERLTELLTEELTAGGTVVLGEAVKATKERYLLETLGLDAYDKKSLMQWTFFGFPMYAVNTGIATSSFAGSAERVPFEGDAPRLSELSEAERYGPVVVRRHLGEDPAGLPPVPPGGVAEGVLPGFLTRLDLSFDFSAPGVYTKHDAFGQVVTPPVAGCPEPEGCYYTLNGLIERGTGVTDQPIQPAFIFDSRLSGTSQHGVLWTGGTYQEETGWIPVFATLQSNVETPTGHGAAPRHHHAKPGGKRSAGSDDPATNCRPSDREVSSLVVPTGTAVAPPEAPSTYSTERLFQVIDFEIFYFNNTDTGAGNCDRQGPVIAPDPAAPFSGAYHQVVGPRIDWRVKPTTPDEVWRVVVVYDDPVAKVWTPVELTRNGDAWEGSVSVTGTDLITYMIQAVDLRGNVSWVDFVAAAALRAKTSHMPASGVELDVPLPVDVSILPGTTDLAVTLSASPDPAVPLAPLAYTIEVTNEALTVASAVQVDLALPAGVSEALAGGDGWSCDSQVRCTRETLAAGATSTITVFVNLTAAVCDPLEATVTVSSFDVDTDLNDNTVMATTAVLAASCSMIFEDGFESGDVLLWTSSVGAL